MFEYKIGILVALSTCFFVYIHSEGVGSSCFDVSDCGLWHFVCENGICRCDAEHIPDRENKWCAVDILEACGYHDECYDPNAECVGVAIPKYGSCQCKKGFTLHGTKKVCSVVIGNNCSRTEDCIEGTCKLALPCENNSCNYTQCFCNEPLQSDVNGTKCRPALNDDCSQFNECAREHAICKQIDKEKKCLCDVNYKETTREINNVTGTYCLAKLDISCKNTTDCADSGAACVEKNETKIAEPLTCKKSKIPYWPDWPPTEPPAPKFCVCGEGFVRHPEPDPNDPLDVSECLKVATKLNDTCIHNIQCTAYSGFGSECVEGKCKCQKGFYFDVDFDRCVRSCLCNDYSEVADIIGVLKELAPTIEVLAKNSNIDISELIRKITKLTQ